MPLNTLILHGLAIAALAVVTIFLVTHGYGAGEILPPVTMIAGLSGFQSYTDRKKANGGVTPAGPPG